MALGMIAADVKKLQPPPQIFELEDEVQATWMAGFETMRSVVLFLLDEEFRNQVHGKSSTYPMIRMGSR